MRLYDFCSIFMTDLKETKAPKRIKIYLLDYFQNSNLLNRLFIYEILLKYHLKHKKTSIS